MSSDTGLARMLPPIVPPNQQDDAPPIKERNVFMVLLNYKNQLLVEGEWCNVSDLKEKAPEKSEKPAEASKNDEDAIAEIIKRESEG